jgi:hypothetical protein
MPRPTYELTLHKTYYDKGFFNLGVSVDKFIRPTSGPIRIALGKSKRMLDGHVNRDANQNGTARIFGGTELRDWFYDNYSLKDEVIVHMVSPTSIHID